MPIADKDIDQAYSDYRVTCGGVREDYFALLYLMQEFGLPVEIAKRQVAFHGHDYGIDAYHLDPERRALYLLQFKWSQSHREFQKSFERLIGGGVMCIFGNGSQDRLQNELLVRLKEKLAQCKDKVEAVYLHFVFNGNPKDAEQSLVLGQLTEDLYARRYLLDEFYGRPMKMRIEFLRPPDDPPPPPQTANHIVKMEGVLRQIGPSGEVMHLGFIRLMDLEAMFQCSGQRFFARNIRSFIGEGTAPNRAIVQSLRRIVHEAKENPGVFAFNHNGVTLAALRFEQNGEGYILTGPQLLNGAQTVTTFSKFLNDARTKTASADSLARLGDLRVPCKIITSASDAFITTVTINNNRQNPVEPWNLRANDLIQLKLQEKFRDELKIYYERQEEAFTNMSRQELEQQGITHHKAIELLRLTKTFLVADGEIDKASRMNDVFESDTTYNKVFSEQRLGVDARLIALCYKAQFRLNPLIREIEESYKSYYYIRHARNLLWALLCQGMLNDERLADYAEEYGASIVREPEYNEWLHYLAMTPARLLLAGMRDSHADEISAQRYSFLRKKPVWEECMSIAYKKWGWVKKRLA